MGKSFIFCNLYSGCFFKFVIYFINVIVDLVIFVGVYCYRSGVKGNAFCLMLFRFFGVRLGFWDGIVFFIRWMILWVGVVFFNFIIIWRDDGGNGGGGLGGLLRKGRYFIVLFVFLYLLFSIVFGMWFRI